MSNFIWSTPENKTIIVDEEGNEVIPEADGVSHGVIRLGNDLGGTSQNPIVLRINGATVPASNSQNSGQILKVVGNDNLAYGSLELDNPESVSGILGVNNLPNATTLAKGIIQLTNDIGGTSEAPTVIKLNGSSIPVGGSLNVGQILKASGSSSLEYGPLDLNNSNSITGILSNSHLPDATTLAKGIIKLSNDLGGDATDPIVKKINGASVPAAGALTIGMTLRVVGVSELSYGPLDLANNDAITGILNIANLPDASTGSKGIIQLAGDLAGSVISPIVAKLNGASIPAAGALTTDTVLKVNGNSSLVYGALNLGSTAAVTGTLSATNLPDAGTGAKGIVQLAGDLAGTAVAPVVSKLNGASIGAAGALVTDSIVKVSGVAALTYGALNLASSNAVTGILAAANLPDATTLAKGIIQLAGDLAGTVTSPIVSRINGATCPAAGSLVTGTVLRATGTAALAYGALDLANSNAVTGVLAGANLADAVAGTKGAIRLAGDMGGSASSPTIVSITGNAGTANVAATLTKTSLANNSATVTCGELIKITKTVSVVNGSTGNIDTTIWQCPARFKVISCNLRVTTAITLAGGLPVSNLRLGSTIGGNELISYAIAGTETTSTNPIGYLLSHLGSDLSSLAGYTKIYLSATTFTLRVATSSGTIPTGAVEVSIIGYLI